MPGKIFIDTNVVIYALGQASTKAHLAAPLFVAYPSISTQVLSETANVHRGDSDFRYWKFASSLARLRLCAELKSSR